MASNSKLLVYKGMIQYLLESTNYTLKNIADLSSSSINNIRSIYCDEVVPSNFSSEIQLLRLYQTVLEINIKGKEFANYSSIPKRFQLIYARTAG